MHLKSVTTICNIFVLNASESIKNAKKKHQNLAEHVFGRGPQQTKAAASYTERFFGANMLAKPVPQLRSPPPPFGALLCALRSSAGVSIFRRHHKRAIITHTCIQLYMFVSHICILTNETYSHTYSFTRAYILHA